MASVYDIKPAFQSLLRPTCKRLAAAGVTANQVTLFAMLVSLLVGVLVGGKAGDWPWLWLLLPVWLFLRMALNAIDGMLAREHHQASKLGALLNELGDVIADAGLYLPLALTPAFSVAPVTIFVLLAVLTEMTGVAAIQIGASRRYDGPMGKSDRALLIGAIGFLLAVGVPLSAWTDGLVWLAGLLCLVTVVNRARKALQEVA